MRQAFVTALLKQAKRDKRIMLLTGDLGFRVVEPFAETLPEQFLNVGVAEANLVTVAAGLASTGFIPVIYSIATFMSMRAFEFIRDDVAFQKLNVKIVGVGGGLAYGPAGATHHAIEDIAMMRMLPGMTIISPSGATEAGQATKALLDHEGPVYFRIERNPQEDLILKESFRIGKARMVTKGKHVAILTTGTELETGVRVRELLQKKKIYPTLVSFPTIDPLDSEMITQLSKTHQYIVTIEEHCVNGGFGTAILELVHATHMKYTTMVTRFGLEKRYVYGSYSYEALRNMYNLTPEYITKEIITITTKI